MKYIHSSVLDQPEPHPQAAADPVIEFYSLRRLPSLDGWRAVSICMVLVSHSPLMVGFPEVWKIMFSRIFDGNLGVRCFFLISGFLITWLMIKEQQKNGSVNLKLFYYRRGLRILPVCFAYLLVIFILSVIAPFKQSWGIWRANITFTTNFMMDRNWHGVPWPSIHLWSLAIEEQFYLIWPPAFAAIGFLTNRSALVKLVLAALLIAPLSRLVSIYELYDPAWSWLFSPASFFNYFDTIAYGCVCAVLLAIKPKQMSKMMSDDRKHFFWLCLAAILMPHILRHYKTFKMVIIMFGPSIQAFGFAGLLLQSVFLPGWGLYRVFNWRLVRFVGVLSFSLYIWQQLFCSSPEVFGLAGDSLFMSFPLGWLFAAVTAILSYFLVERPFMSLRARLRPLA